MGDGDDIGRAISGYASDRRQLSARASDARPTLPKH
jgi:hypothetical protein